jgi:hypothetical protein
MSKNGRYAADRKKVATLTNAVSTTGTVAQCGTIFIATGASGTTTYVLPAIADAGKGWWCKVVKSAAAGAGGTIVISAAAADGGSAMVGIESSLTSVAIAGDDITLANGTDPGALVECICDGSQWLVHAVASTAADVSIA